MTPNLGTRSQIGSNNEFAWQAATDPSSRWLLLPVFTIFFAMTMQPVNPRTGNLLGDGADGFAGCPEGSS